MLLFSNAKINLGLRVLAKRPDGYHDLETIMIPVGFSDLLEFIKSTGKETEFVNTGIQLDCSYEDNLVFKAFKLLRNDFKLPELRIHLHKLIPSGAGLGGGSSNAAFMLKGLNKYFELGIDDRGLENYAAMLGSDCPFFIRNTSCLAEGRGEVLTGITQPVALYMVLLYPGFPVSTKDAYNRLKPRKEGISLTRVFREDPITWKDSLVNSFEETVFSIYPKLAVIKTSLYEQGAFYASMSGSGSCMYGLFTDKPALPPELEKIKVWEGGI